MDKERSEQPLVSVILPVRNEADYICKTLGSVLDQDYPSELLELIVVDGMSDDGTQEIIRQFRRDNPNRTFHLICNPHRIFSSGFNKGLRLARGKVIVMLGGHTELCTNYVERCIKHLSTAPVGCVGGVLSTYATSFRGETIAAAMSTPFGVGGVTFRTGLDQNDIRDVDTVAFGAYMRSTIEITGGLDEELERNQDDEFNYRLRKIGGRILLDPHIHSRYYGRSSLRALWQQYFHYGVWKVRVLQKHPRQMRPRQFAPPAFVGSILGSGVLALFQPLGKLLLALILALYLAANLMASVWTASKRGWKHLPLLPIVYAILHVSYGMGFLVGLVRFIHRWGDKKGEVPEWRPGELRSQGAWGLASVEAGDTADAD